MTKKLKIGVIGCGAIAQNGHLPFYNHNENIQLFVSDLSVDRLKEVALMCRYKVGVDFLVYTPDEINEAVEEGNDFITDEILGRGKVLYSHEQV